MQEKEKYGIPHRWDLKKKKNDTVDLQNRNRLTDSENKHVIVQR